MKCISAFIYVMLSSLSLLAPTDAAPDSMVARALPHPASVADAKIYLAALTIKPKAHGWLYQSSLFPHWDIISGKCHAREVVLQRDGTNVKTDASCKVISGSWYSIYDKKTRTHPEKLAIDHIVPLREAWISGASEWSTANRREFANDLVRPQLITVTESVKEAKGDLDPAHWMPPNTDFHCTYVRAWITVKHHYKLSIDPDEYYKLKKVLNTC